MAEAAGRFPVQPQEEEEEEDGPELRVREEVRKEEKKETSNSWNVTALLLFIALAFTGLQ
jgi:hypothetical protein